MISSIKFVRFVCTILLVFLLTVFGVAGFGYDSDKDKCIDFTGQSDSWRDDIISSEENRCCGDDWEVDCGQSKAWEMEVTYTRVIEEKDYVFKYCEVDGNHLCGSLGNNMESTKDKAYEILQKGEIIEDGVLDELYGWAFCPDDGIILDYSNIQGWDESARLRDSSELPHRISIQEGDGHKTGSWRVDLHCEMNDEIVESMTFTEVNSISFSDHPSCYDVSYEILDNQIVFDVQHLDFSGEAGYVAESIHSWDYICVDKNKDGKAEWVSSRSNSESGTGSDIIGINSHGKYYEVTSDEEKWYACDIFDGPNKFSAYDKPGLEVQEGEQPCVTYTPNTCERSYICYDNGGNATFAKCNDPPLEYDGEVFETGKRIRANETFFYCSQYNKWETDLDCDSVTCEAAGLDWTGSKCCGDDVVDTYNDRLNEFGDNVAQGGCFSSGSVPSGSSTRVTNLLSNWDEEQYWNSFGECIEDSYDFPTLNALSCINKEFGWRRYLYLYPGAEFEFKVEGNADVYSNGFARIGNQRIDDFVLGEVSVDSTYYEPRGELEPTFIELGLDGRNSVTFSDVSLVLEDEDLLNHEGYFYGCNMENEYVEREGKEPDTGCYAIACDGDCQPGCDSTQDSDCGCVNDNGCCGEGCYLTTDKSDPKYDSDCEIPLCELDNSEFPCIMG